MAFFRGHRSLCESPHHRKHYVALITLQMVTRHTRKKLKTALDARAYGRALATRCNQITKATRMISSNDQPE